MRPLAQTHRASAWLVALLICSALCGCTSLQTRRQIGQWETRLHEVFVKSRLKMSDLHRLSVADLTTQDGEEERIFELPDPVRVVLPLGSNLFDSPPRTTIRALRRSLDSPWPEVRYLSMMYLLALHDEELPAICVRRFADEENIDVRIRMIRAFGETSYQPALHILTSLLNSPRDRQTQEAESALIKFGKHATSAVVDSLSGAPDDYTRAQRLRFVLKLKDNGKLGILIPILKNSAEADDVRSAACGVLAHFKYAETIPYLIAILAENRIRYTNLCLADKDALQKFGEPGVQAIVAGIEQSEDAEHRANLIWGLMRPNARGAIPVLTKCLQDKDVNVQRHAITALQQVEGVGSAAKLLPFLDVKPTSGSALLALEKLAKRSFHNDTAACKKWWAQNHSERRTEPQQGVQGDAVDRAP